MSRSAHRRALPRAAAFLFTTLSICALWPAARAQSAASPQAIDEAATRMGETVVTASRIEEELRDTIPHTTILTQSDIRASQAPDVVTLLRREAGIEVAQSGSIGHVSGLFMRGGDTNQALVIIDGVRLNTATTGTAPLEQILLDQIERIEIVRGNVSALYGSEATAGVIQIFTRRGSGAPHGSGAVEAGSFGTRAARADYGGQLRDTRFNLGWSVYHTLGFPALNTDVSPTVDGADDGYSNQTLAASLSQRISAQHSIGGSFFQSEGRADYSDAFAASPNDKHKNATESGVWQVYWDARFLQPWHSRLSFGRSTDYLQDYLDADPVDRTTQHNDTLTWQNDVALGASTTASLGLEQLKQSVDSTTAYARTDRTVRSAFLQLKGMLGRHQFQLAGRYNDYSDFGHHDVYYAGYGFLVTEAVKLTASESSGFRAPTFNELFFPAFGNPSLGPETARTTEVGAQYATATQFLRLAAFRTRYDNLIAATPGTGFMLENVQSAEVRGVELSYRGRLLTLDWNASLTVQRPWDISDDAPLIRRARRFANLGVGRAWGPLRAGLNWHVSGDKQDVDPVTFDRVQVAGYGALDATLSYDLARDWRLGVSGFNLFNRQYTLIDGYNVQRRSVFVSLAYRS